MFHHLIIPKKVSTAQKVGIFQVGNADGDWLSTVFFGELAFKKGKKSDLRAIAFLFPLPNNI